jgi:hypothetical protein
MARRIKRLSDRSDGLLPAYQLMRRDPGAWDRELEWWRGVGVNTVMLLTLLEGTRVKRSQYEKQLEARLDRLTASKIRSARRALETATPLIRLLRTTWSDDEGPGPAELFFGDLGEQVERAVKSYIDTLRGPAPPAHRPGDPWLRDCALLLVRVLLARKQSARQSIRRVESVLKLAGHGDVLGPSAGEKIRHFIREERSRDRRFGAASPAGLGAWFPKEGPKAELRKPGELGRSGYMRPRSTHNRAGVSKKTSRAFRRKRR